jgi:hypothetical protein
MLKGILAGLIGGAVIALMLCAAFAYLLRDYAFD